MKTNNQEILDFIDDVLSAIRDIFKDRCIAVYVMGSLARGAFSELTSDIDMGIILADPLLDSDGENINKVKSQYVRGDNDNHIQNRLSIFWGSIDSINGKGGNGRYPAYDRLDLLEHASLLYGRDIRNELIRPSQKELVIASTRDALDYLSSDERIHEFINCSRMLQKGIIHVTKMALFPARFIYLLKTGNVAGNDMACRYYTNTYSGDDADLVRHAYSWRYQAPPLDIEIEKILKQGLIPLYNRFIDIYSDAMKDYQEPELSRQLCLWKEKLDRGGILSSG